MGLLDFINQNKKPRQISNEEPAKTELSREENLEVMLVGIPIKNDNSPNSLDQIKKSNKWLILFFIIWIVFGYLYIANTWTTGKLANEDQALHIAEIIGISINGEMIKELTASLEDEGTAPYESIKGRLMDVAKNLEGVQFVYIYTQKDDKIYFMADSEPIDSEDYSPPGQEYTEASDNIITAFRDGISILTPPETDRWGTWISALIPMKNVETGEIIAVLGIDYNAGSFYDEVKLNTKQACAIVFVILLVLIVFYLLLNRNVKLNAARESLTLANDAISKSEKRFRRLVSQMQLGLANHEIICDEAGNPVDYRFVSVNDSYERLTGMHREDIVGRTVLQVMPNVEKYWIETYGQVALTGKAEHFENYSAELDKYFSVNAYSPKPGQFATIIDDITEKKKTQVRIKKSEKLFQTMLAVVPDLISIQDKDMNIIYSNWSGFGAVSEENRLLRAKCHKTYRGNDNICPDCPAQDIFKTGAAIDTEVEFGEDKWIRMHILPIRDENDNIEFFAEWVQDISERKNMDKLLFDEKELFKTTLFSVGDGVIATDNQGNVVVLNNVAETLTGWKQSEVIGKPVEEVFNIINEFTRERCDNLVVKVLDTGRSLEIANNTILISKDGQERPIEDSAAPIKDQEENINGVVLVFRDITDKKYRQEKIEYLAFHDQLTGLYNRRFYDEEIKRLDTKRNLPISIIMGDVDALKLINDSFGHTEGDELLKKTAEVIKNACRIDDIIARIGGDEFVVLLPKTDSGETQRIINRIQVMAAKKKVANITLSVSFGYGTKETEDQPIFEIFKNAENHMYRQKHNNRSKTWGESIEIIMNSLFEKSNWELLHSKRVSGICQAIASKMNFGKDDLARIRKAGLVHDIGKIGVDEKILNNKGVLSDVEKEKIHKHPEKGWHILSASNEFFDLAEFVLAHHERWDGNGYPNGLKGEETPVEARIIAIADAYDAMTSKRVYRKRLNKEEAIEELKRCSGTQFDPKIVDVFLNQVLADNIDFLDLGRETLRDIKE
jgi:diguanylate cyclase